MEQLRSLTALMEYAKKVGPRKISVAMAEDMEVMEAVEEARKAGVANAVLVGNKDKISEIAGKLGIDLGNYEIVDERGGEPAVALAAVELVSSGKAEILKKTVLNAYAKVAGILRMPSAEANKDMADGTRRSMPAAL